MNAQGETWTADSALEQIISESDYDHFAPMFGAALEKALAIVRLHPELIDALEKMTKLYTDLVNCGDCGFWDPETDDSVIASRTVLARAHALGEER